MPHMPSATGLACAVLFAFALASAGCESYPRDPHDTLAEIEREGVLWVGVSAHPPWTLVDGRRVGGVEVDLADDLAKDMGVEGRWLVMSESQLIDALQHGEIDLAIAGFTTLTPWKRHVAEIGRVSWKIHEVSLTPVTEIAPHLIAEDPPLARYSGSQPSADC